MVFLLSSVAFLISFFSCLLVDFQWPLILCLFLSLTHVYPLGYVSNYCRRSVNDLVKQLDKIGLRTLVVLEGFGFLVLLTLCQIAYLLPILSASCAVLQLLPWFWRRVSYERHIIYRSRVSAFGLLAMQFIFSVFLYVSHSWHQIFLLYYWLCSCKLWSVICNGLWIAEARHTIIDPSSHLIFAQFLQVQESWYHCLCWPCYFPQVRAIWNRPDCQWLETTATNISRQGDGRTGRCKQFGIADGTMLLVSSGFKANATLKILEHSCAWVSNLQDHNEIMLNNSQINFYLRRWSLTGA